MYTTEKFTADIAMKDYTADYVDVDKFIVYCKQCPNYDKKWSCPSYDFDQNDYWAKYEKLKVIGLKIIFDKETAGKSYSPEEMRDIIKSCIKTERAVLDDEVLALEKSLNGRAFYAGSCMLCAEEKCARIEGKECRHPDKVRYSLESLGADVSKTTEKLLGITLKWGEKNKLPEYYTLVCAVAY